MDKTMQVKVSVIIPVYNAEMYLADTLESVFSQTISPYEVICVDDGSTDASLNILSEYADKVPNLKILTQKNSGAGVARNNGIKAANGKYVAFMDADDLDPNNNTLELLYDKAEKIMCI